MRRRRAAGRTWMICYQTRSRSFVYLLSSGVFCSLLAAVTHTDVFCKEKLDDVRHQKSGFLKFLYAALLFYPRRKFALPQRSRIRTLKIHCDERDAAA
ncbi:hypothetical protein THAOC_20882 [Thalassiosira oceanica]|uniref:Uncharacterized protein n=1 Tax=Thalassiosira oceanica TaxID=159749 RepID=K0S2A5_THAOC|nr:hypothetical protein THAOC_20882 [Thalassiosira oceanica]|eukprot:EJK58954.1 hypothetical protein THAOC_20882 [Thalassiosira oceanica]